MLKYIFVRISEFLLVFPAVLSFAAAVSAADIPIGNGQTVKLSELAAVPARTDSITGPTAAGEKGTFYYDGAVTNYSGTTFQGKVSGNLDFYFTATQNLRFNSSTTDFVGDFYHQSGSNVYFSTGKEAGTGTLYWSGGGQIVNCGNDNVRNCVLDCDIVLLDRDHTMRAGWNDGGYKAYMTLNGIISGTKKLVFNGNNGEGTPGIFTLNGVNTYSGGTDIYGTPNTNATNKYVTVIAGTNSAFGTAAVNFYGNSLLDVSKVTAIANAVTYNVSGDFKTHEIQNNGTNEVTLSSVTTKADTTLNVKNTSTGALNFTTLTVGGTMNLTNTSTGTINFSTLAVNGTMNFYNGGTGTITFGTSDAKITPTGTGTIAFQDPASAFITAGGSTVGISGPTDAGEVLNLTMYGDYQTYNGKLSGNINLTVANNVRFVNNSSDFTGTITSTKNIYFRYGNEMGNKKSNVITFTGGQIVNQNVSNPVIPNDVVIKSGTTTIRAGWNKIGDDGNSVGDESSVTLTGDISGVGAIAYGAEADGGAIYLRGNNSYSGGTTIAYGYDAGKSLKQRCWFGIGSNSAFGTGTLTLNTDMPTTVLNFETQDAGGNAVTRTLSNNMVVSKNALQFSNGGVGNAFITGNITGASASAIQFGTPYAAENVGKIFYNGTTTKNAVVNAGAALGGTGSLGGLTVNEDGTLYLSSAMNYTDALEAGDLTLDGQIVIDLDRSVGTENSLFFADSTTLGDDFSILINYSGDRLSPIEIDVLNFGTGVDVSDLANHIQVAGLGDWGYNLGPNGLLTLSVGAPEPAAWLLFVLTFAGGLCFQRRNTRSRTISA